MNDSPASADTPGSSPPARKGVTGVLVVVLVLAILALLALIGNSLLPALGPRLEAGWQRLQLSMADLRESSLPILAPPHPTTAANACPEHAVLAYEDRAALLNEQASQSAQAAYTAYTQLVQVQVPYCLVALKAHHVKLFYARYMAARAVANRNSAEAARYAEDVLKYVDLATAERDRLEARYGWTHYK